MEQKIRLSDQQRAEILDRGFEVGERLKLDDTQISEGQMEALVRGWAYFG